MTMTKKSVSYNQNELKIICDRLCDNIDVLLEALGIEYKQTSKMITMSCPIHGGDNMSALNLYPDGDNYRGNWKCRTHGCEHTFKSSIIGFIRGVMSRNEMGWSKEGDPTISFANALSFAKTILKNNFENIKVSKTTVEKNNFTSFVSNITPSSTENIPRISRASIRKNLVIPAQYFIDRGFDSTILDKYDVGLCDKPEKEMFGRAVAPIYDADHKYMVGCTGRSVFDKCAKCNSYHSDKDNCPNEENQWKYSKWKHNFGFKTQNHLYNMWYAKTYIQDTKTIIVVESPGNVWKLEQCGFRNSVAIFGSSLSNTQKMIIDSSGAMQMILLLDNDDAGLKATNIIAKKCARTYNIYTPQFVKTDIADTPCDIIVEHLSKLTERFV